MKYIKANWPSHPAVKAYTTLREGWQSTTESLTSLLGLPNEPLWLNQKHTTLSVPAETIRNHKTIADACYTSKPAQVCAIATGDCLPLLISNQAGTHIAAIHAGWRGLANGIIESTLNVLNLPPEELLVWLGPAIGPKQFEVGDDVYEAFTQYHPESALAFYSLRPGKWLADLYTLASIRLQLRNIDKIYGGEFCTYSQSDMFFSHRRQESGRMATVIWIEEPLLKNI